MKLNEVVKNQIAVTHMMEMMEKIDELKNILPEKYEIRLDATKDLLKECVDEVTEYTLPEWMKWSRMEEP